jgi:hypothetical protein
MVWRQRWNRAEPTDYWRQQIADWKKSGQKILAFCNERNLTESQFHFWRASARRQSILCRPKSSRMIWPL